jgi:hypothetical protein
MHRRGGSAKDPPIWSGCDCGFSVYVGMRNWQICSGFSREVGAAGSGACLDQLGRRFGEQAQIVVLARPLADQSSGR